MIRSVFILFMMSLSSIAQGQSFVENLKVTAALDALAPFDFEHSHDNKFQLRSTELMLYGPLDPTFDLLLNVAAHDNEGEMTTEIHEAYLSSSKLIPSSRFKLGKFFLGIGRLNQFHTHDWPFVSAPRVQAEFFSEEAVIDTGGEFSVLLPADSYWDLTVGITNGYTFGSHQHGHEEGEEDHDTSDSHRPHLPTHYLRLVNFQDFGNSRGLQWGLNYLGRTSGLGEQIQLYGLDFVLKRTRGKTVDFLFQAELWYRHLSAPTEDLKQEAGAYAFAQWSLSEQLFAGIRLDLFKSFSLNFEGTTERQDNLNYAVVPTITFKNSEFTYFRAAYVLDTLKQQRQSDQVEQTLQFQFVALLGAHPVHSF